MRILCTNDDGIDAPGLRALEEVAARLAERLLAAGFRSVHGRPPDVDVWTVAPATEQSAKSHSFTMHDPLRVQQHGPRRFSVTGTPADCSYLALHHLLPGRPDLVLSGINRGANLSNDVLYSGTVAAAREAAGHGVPSLAASLWVTSETPRWETAQAVLLDVAVRAVLHGIPEGVLLNLNVPDVPPGELKGVRVAPLGRRWYAPAVEEKTDPRGRRYYWIGGDHERFDDAPASDGPLCEQGWAVVTPLQMDLTAHELLPALRAWGLEESCSTT
jgi:5'-nucleotidase